MPFSLKLWGSCLKGEIRPPFGSLCLRILFLHDEYPADQQGSALRVSKQFFINASTRAYNAWQPYRAGPQTLVGYS
jgi:hypothetical protein